MPHCRWRVTVVLTLALGVFLLQISSAGAVFHRGKPPSKPRLRATTDMKMSGTGPGQGVTGFIATGSNAFDPVKDGYPSGNPPTTGSPPLWNAKNEGFAGVIHGTPVGGGPTLNLYCIDIFTETYGGIGYVLGSWEASGVPNVGYVARLLNDYYPNTNEPSAFSNTNQKAAAVQAAIWFFSDRYVLSTSDQLRSEVVKIVNDVIAKGPLVQPPPPTLTLTPGSLSEPHKVVGPFTVNTDHPPATVTATGGTMYSDRAGTELLGDGSTADVPSGQQIWLRAEGDAKTAQLQAVSTAKVPSGNVYLYDGNTAGVNDAQRLILAQPAVLRTTVRATAQFVPYGSLLVRKTIGGPAAGSQSRVVITVDCTDGKTRHPLVIQAGAPAGKRFRIYRHIPAGTTCTVTETANGSNATTDVTVTGDGQEVAIPAGGKVVASLEDVYHFVPGSLIVSKTIAGPGAGQQGEITIHTVCDGQALSPDFVIPAGTPAGGQSQQYDDIPTPATCTVTETADGSTSTVSVVVEGSGQTVAVPPGSVVETDLSDTYGLVPGQLEVTKTITGPAAGSQGQVVIHTVCDGTALTPDLVIPAGTPAGDQSQLYSGIPTPANCVVTETANGANSTTSVVVTGSPDTVTIPPGGMGAAHITDTYGAVDGSLLVTKTIAGPRAGHQGPVTIHVTCDGVAQSPDFVIPAGTKAGSVSHSFNGIPAGSVCTVVETADGGTAKVVATVTGNNQSVTVPAGKVASVELSDVYKAAPGDLVVKKKIAGPAAHQHGRIGIVVACGGPIFVFSIRIVPGSTTSTVVQHFDNIPAGSRCTIDEAPNGHTNTIRVTPRGPQKVTIRAGEQVTAQLEDTFRVKPFRPPKPRVTG
jgi:Domain of unknown function (DUF5979)/Thioester domain